MLKFVIFVVAGTFSIAALGGDPELNLKKDIKSLSLAQGAYQLSGGDGNCPKSIAVTVPADGQVAITDGNSNASIKNMQIGSQHRGYNDVVLMKRYLPFSTMTDGQVTVTADDRSIMESYTGTFDAGGANIKQTKSFSIKFDKTPNKVGKKLEYSLYNMEIFYVGSNIRDQSSDGIKCRFERK